MLQGLMKFGLISMIFLLGARAFAQLPYQDPALSVGERVADLLSRMTLAEKIGQMTQVERSSLQSLEDITSYRLGSLLSGGGSTPRPNTPQAWADMVDGYQRKALATPLAIPLLYGVDAVHGHNNVVGATIFPHNIGLGATRNAELVRQVGVITASEVYATGIRWTFSPCLCVARDERWGRTYESFGEDPEIARMMTTIIEGYQGGSGGVSATPGTVMATAKHWVGDGGTLWGTGGSGYRIDQGDARLSEAELRAIHIPPYVDAIDRGVGSVMPSFSSWNGTRLHASSYLINDVLKGELGFDGFVISDWQAIDRIPGDYGSDVRSAINAGVDMVMVPHDYRRFIATLTAEVDAGNVAEARIDEAVTRILTKKFELGLFEQPTSDRDDPSASFGAIGSAAHRDVARRAVRESMVLLKNDDVLPLDPSRQRVLVAGRGANDIGYQVGGWTITWQGSGGAITPGTTIFAGLREVAPAGATVDFHRRPDGRTLSDYDVAVVVVGESPYAEGRGDDNDLALSVSDRNLIDSVCSVMPCVVVLISGRPMIITDQVGDANVQAIVAAWLPGSEGAGVAEVLYGHHDFKGTLPLSWPRDMSQIPINVGDGDYQADPPLYPYGYGLTLR